MIAPLTSDASDSSRASTCAPYSRHLDSNPSLPFLAADPRGPPVHIILQSTRTRLTPPVVFMPFERTRPEQYCEYRAVIIPSVCGGYYPKSRFGLERIPQTSGRSVLACIRRDGYASQHFDTSGSSYRCMHPQRRKHCRCGVWLHPSPPSSPESGYRQPKSGKQNLDQSPPPTPLLCPNVMRRYDISGFPYKSTNVLAHCRSTLRAWRTDHHTGAKSTDRSVGRIMAHHLACSVRNSPPTAQISRRHHHPHPQSLV